MIGSASTNPPVLLVSLGVSYGGAESYYIKLAKILQRQHDLIAVVCSPRLLREFEALGIQVRYAGDNLGTAGRYIQSLKACRQLIRIFRPRIAHLNGQPESYLAPLLRVLGLRVITTRHTPFTDLFIQTGSGIPIFIKKAILLFCLRCALTTICVSRLLQSQLHAYAPRLRLPMIPTWVEDRMLTPYPRSSSSDPLRVLFVGRVVRNKGIFELIEAIRHCRGVHLTVVGEGSEMEEAMRLAESLPITFQGFLQDCTPAYQTSDLLIFASPEGFEGLPQVPLEAMAMGIPCLASDISSVLELAETEPGEPSVVALFKQGDVDDLAAHIAHLVEDRVELARLGLAGRTQVMKRFTVEAVAGSYLAEFAAATR